LNKFSEALKRLRGEVSQAEFARRLGIEHQATYQRYEAGRIPKAPELHRMATRIGVTVEDLLEGKVEGKEVDVPEEARAEPEKNYGGGLDLAAFTEVRLIEMMSSCLADLAEADADRKKRLLAVIRTVSTELEGRLKRK
jgi:transcriptional regulator with XRE-family HTH domain